MSFLTRLIPSLGGAMLLPGFIAMLILWEIATPPKLSIVVAAYETLGYGNARATEIRTEASAKFEHEMRMAVAEVDRVTNAYNGLWQLYTTAVRTSIARETTLFDRQIETIRGSQWVPQFLTNFAALGCALEGMAQDAESASTMRGACQQSEEWREEMVAQYADIIPRHRTNMTQEMIEQFPPPAEILSPEFERVAAKYRGE